MDSLTLTDKLRDAGFNDRQAAVIAQGVFAAVETGVAVVEANADELVTKADLKAGLERFESNLRAEMHAMKADLMKFVIISLAAFATVVVAIEKLL